MKKILLAAVLSMMTWTGIMAQDVSDADYQAALAAITDGGTYRIKTNVSGTDYYVTTDGGLTSAKDNAGSFTITKTSGGYFGTGFRIDSGTERFTNPPLSNGSANLKPGNYAHTTSDRADWERQILYLNGEGKYAIRSCNCADGTSSWDDAARTHWTTYWVGDIVTPCYTYDKAYDWDIEALTTVNVTYKLVESDGTTVVGTEKKKQNAYSSPVTPLPLTGSVYNGFWHEKFCYDYAVSGTIGDTDCTITIVRTMKAVTDLSELSNDIVYNIGCDRGAMVINNGSMVSTALNDATVNAQPLGRFSIINDEDKYYLYSVDEGKFVTNTGALVDDLINDGHGEKDAIVMTKQQAAPYFLWSFNTDNAYLNTNGNAPLGYVINSYRTPDTGNQYFMVPVDDFNPTYTVTYVIKDVFGNVLFTSNPQPTTLGTVISSLPDDFKRDYYTYNEDDVEVTITDVETTVEFIATWNGPFELSADFATAHWYNMSIRGTWYVTTDVKDDDGAYRPQNANTMSLIEESYHWAFTGNGYDGIKILNKAEGEGKSFGYTDANKTNAGIPTILDDAEGNHGWKIVASTNTSVPANPFCLNVPGTNLYINQFGGAGGSMKFWNSASNIGDQGSAFNVYEVPSSFLLTLTASGNGVIEYEETSVRSSSQSFDVAKLSEVVLTITPDAGHHVETLTINDEDALPRLTDDGKLFLAPPAPKGAWTFDDGTTGSLTATAGVTVADGVATVPVGDYLTATDLGAAANSGTYTIMFDVKVANATKYCCLFNNDLTKDGSLFFYHGMLGLNTNGLGYNGTVEADTWYRVVFVSENANVSTYLDGVLVGHSTSADKEHWKLGSELYFFADDDGEEQEISVDELRFWDVALTADEVGMLGAYSNVASSFGSMTSSVTVDVTFAANAIDFADANVKTLCVANWDTNGDGELSYDEAAAVTDLGTVFCNNDDITSFNELQYFTGLTKIVHDAFASCNNLGSINIPSSVTEIEYQAFVNCPSLTSVVIPNGVTHIDYNTFANTGISSITLPESVTTLYGSAFACLPNLKSLTIPAHVTKIDGNPFVGCNALKTILVDEGNPVYHADGNCIIETAKNRVVSGCNESTIPSYVTILGRTSFCNLDFKEFNVPEGITTLEGSVFNNMFYLETITLPSTLQSLNESAIYYCHVLKSITVNITNPFPITNLCEKGNNVLSTLYVPAGTKAKYENTEGWKEIPNIVEMGVNGNSPIDFADANVKTLCVANWDTNGDGELSYDEAAAVTDLGTVFCNNDDITSFNELQYFTGLTSIGDDAFSFCEGLTSVFIPYGVTSIGRRAFRGCENMNSINFPNSLTIINTWAFGDCNSLTSITIPNSVTTFDGSVFSGCSGLTSVTIGSGLRSLRNFEFRGCTSLASIKIDEGNPYFDSRNDCNAIIETSTNKLLYGCKNSTIPEGVTAIGHAAFEGHTGMTAITIPESVTYIDDYAFDDCTGLTTITIPEGVTSIGEVVFRDCSGLTSVVLPESLTSIGWNAFCRCDNLSSINIPENVTFVGGEAFYRTAWLNNQPDGLVYVGKVAYKYKGSMPEKTEIKIKEGTVMIAEEAFADCINLTGITIPSSVTTIGEEAFKNCGLTAVTIPESVTDIGYNAFIGCYFAKGAFVNNSSAESSYYNNFGAKMFDVETSDGLLIDNNTVIGCRSWATAVVIPYGVIAIGYEAFGSMEGGGNPNLTSVTIPNSVTNIESGAFYGCDRLTNITSYIKEPFAIYDNVFNGVHYETATLYVPAGTIDAYRATDGWKNFQNIEVILQQLTIAVVGDGVVTFSGEALTDTTATFNVAGEVQLLLTPEEGCYIERVMVNQQDCTSEVKDGVLNLNVIDEDYFVLAEFQHNAVIEPDYVTYTIYIDGPGDVRVEDRILINNEQEIRVPKGGNLVLEFLPEEGQMVDKVTWNGETVTKQVLGNTFVVRDVQEDGTVSVIFMEQIETFEYAGIRYGVTDNTLRIVKVLPYDYSGHLSIPASFEHSQRTWQVQEIGNLAFANCEWLVSAKIPSSISKTGKNLFKRDNRLAAILWNPELPLRTEVTGELTNANMLYYVKDKSYAPQNGNVIVNGMADNISLSDGHDFYCPETFKAKKVAYSHIYKMTTRRGNRQGWETLVLPFNVETIRLSREPDNPEIYPYESLTDDDKVERGETLPFWLYGYNDDDMFTPAAAIEANTPYIISMPNDAVYLPMFRLAGSVTFSAQADTGVEVQSTTEENLKTPGTQRTFHPSYQRQVMGNDCYLVNVNDSVDHQFAEGSKFMQALRPSRPFEAYMISQTASAKLWFDIFEQIPTDIRDIQTKENEREMEKIYDLNGRIILNSESSAYRLKKGIYIINGKKQVIR